MGHYLNYIHSNRRIPLGGLTVAIRYYGMLGMCCVVIANREQYVGAQQCMEFACLTKRDTNGYQSCRNRWVLGKVIPY